MSVPCCRAVLRASLLITSLFLFAGCGQGELYFQGTARDEHLAIAAAGYLLRETTNRKELRVEVSAQNVGTEPIIIYDDPSLPTILHEPFNGADVLFGLRPNPTHALYEGAERLRWLVLQPGSYHKYAFCVSNPLQENAPYDNPAYADQKSEWFGRRPKDLFWAVLKLRVAYIIYSSNVQERLRSDTALTYHIGVLANGRTQSVLDLQISVGLSLWRTQTSYEGGP